MTQLLDLPVATGSTLYPRLLVVPDLVSAEGFYLEGAVPTRQIQIRVGGPDGNPRVSWLASYMEERINELLRLRPGWDGRRALPSTDHAVGSAIGLLFRLADDVSLPPQVFPLPDGGLQLEWHAGASLEVEIDPMGDAHMLATDDRGAITLNGELEPGNETLLALAAAMLRELSLRVAGGSGVV